MRREDERLLDVVTHECVHCAVYYLLGWDVHFITADPSQSRWIQSHADGLVIAYIPDGDPRTLAQRGADKVAAVMAPFLFDRTSGRDCDQDVGTAYKIARELAIPKDSQQAFVSAHGRRGLSIARSRAGSTIVAALSIALFERDDRTLAGLARINAIIERAVKAIPPEDFPKIEYEIEEVTNNARNPQA